MDPRIGSTLGPYRINSLLGRGGMGVVYEASQEYPSRHVALKILAPELSADVVFRRRFERESNLAAAIDHPNIVPIYDAGASEGLLFIAMRLVRGRSLNQLLKESRRLSLERTLEVMEQVASALDAAHSAGLVHRDVKPANILLVETDSKQNRGHVYLTDFGLTKRQEGATSLTGTGQFVGTLNYVAPEQIRGEAVDGRTDVYALGCVFYECLTGSPPFAREMDVATMYAHLTEPPPILVNVDAYSADLDRVIAKALAKNPDDRFATCEAFVTATMSPSLLGPSDSSKPTLPEPPAGVAEQDTAPYPARPARRRGLRLTLVLLLSLGLIGGVLAAVLIWSGQGQRETANQAPSTTPQHSVDLSPSTPTGEPVVAERPPQDFELFNEAISGTTPWVTDTEELVGGSLDDVIGEAVLLGTWYALADWCETTGRNQASCYDLSAAYMERMFDRDPRTINDDAWGQAGAVGALIADGYDVTASYLGTPGSDSRDTSTDRPGIEWLCEPSCVEAADPGETDGSSLPSTAEEAAQAFLDAWLAGDRTAALEVADPRAVELVFASEVTKGNRPAELSTCVPGGTATICYFTDVVFYVLASGTETEGFRVTDVIYGDA